MTITITVKKIHTDEYMKKKEGKFFDNENVKIYKKDVDIYTEDGTLLLKFRKNVISEKDTSLLFNNLKKAATQGSRAAASGIPDDGKKYTMVTSKTSGKPLFVSTTKANSGVVGYYDTTSMFGRHINKSKNKSGVKCRKTGFTNKNYEKFIECLPIFKRIDRLYKKLVPDYYKIQLEAIKKLNQDYRIPETIWTTVTVNKTFRTALHKDAGDFKEGFGNLVACSQGDYEGAYTMFPQYGVGIDLRDGDFVAMNVHEWHCNSPMIGDGTRISFVFYLREKMLKNCPLIRKSRSMSSKIPRKVRKSTSVKVRRKKSSKARRKVSNGK